MAKKNVITKLAITKVTHKKAYIMKTVLELIKDASARDNWILSENNLARPARPPALPLDCIKLMRSLSLVRSDNAKCRHSYS